MAHRPNTAANDSRVEAAPTTGAQAASRSVRRGGRTTSG